MGATDAQKKEQRSAWDPLLPGLIVRIRDNPGRQGVTTGRTKKAGTFLLVEVNFGPNDKQFKQYDLLELAEPSQDMLDVLEAGQFGGPADLRRVITLEKVRGDLTNVFYSMEASNTDFYPHQFKPVLKFIESPVGRLLIADEVGLGKTIEAMYIWKELQARAAARRLLIVCPAMLREKWRGDLKTRFNLAADILSSAEVLRKATDAVDRIGNSNFVCISSLEGLRPPRDYEDEKTASPRAQFARLLDQNKATDEFAVFDLVIVDEAHYLRNPATLSNRLANLLAEAARHTLLLTATPIQIHSHNLYQLLRLVDPEQFYDATLFDDMLRANGPIVRALRAVWRIPPNVDEAKDALGSALRHPYFASDEVLERVSAQLVNVGNDLTTRIELARLLESRSLLNQYMTRSRKREVLEKRVERAPQVLKVRFSVNERAVYQSVTDGIRQKALYASSVGLFSLIIRQRQMASCLVAALEGWQEKGLLEELLWEDAGILLPLSDRIVIGDDDDSSADQSNDDNDLPPVGADLRALEADDAKYAALRTFLASELAKAPQEKFVVFAFFRGTLKYLLRRLSADGIRASIIMGDMGDAKNDVLKEFARPDGPSVLLSSEVGSEGIDLQFCRFLVNYDLPWNPMRVEQRIGRLDRLGQKSERISIINLVVDDTIEDRIIYRLYERIELFRESIGDLEQILGQMTDQLMVELLNPALSDEERDARARQTELAIINSRAQQQELEAEAVNLVGFSDFILDTINESRRKGRWLAASELIALVSDFFEGKYLGTRIQPHEKLSYAARIRLSEEAKTRLNLFINQKRPATRTRLHQANAPILCVFDARQAGEFGRDVEIIEPTHPLIQWIRSEQADEQQLHPISAIRLDSEKASVARGDYAYVVHRWSFQGLKEDHVLAFACANVDGTDPPDLGAGEDLVVAALTHGRSFPNARNLVPSLVALRAKGRDCEDALDSDFGKRAADFEAENTLRCNQQETGARKFSARIIAERKGRLERFKAEGRLNLIPMTEGLLAKAKRELESKLATIATRRHVNPTIVRLAAGIIRVD